MSARDLPPLKALRAFEAAGRHRSISRAAEELSVTPGAVSRQIRLLEDWLGRDLFTRHHRQIELTEAGRRYIADIAKALALIGDATRPLMGGDRQGPLKICSYPTFTQRWLITRWKEFHRQHPGIAIEFATSMHPANEPAGQYDALIVMGHHAERWHGWEAVHLCHVEMVPVCSPGLLAASGGHIGPGDLAGQTLIRGAPRPDDWARWMEENGVTGIASDTGPMFENFNFAIQAAIEGAGLLLADRVLAADELADGRLVRPFGPGRRTSHSFYLLYPAHKGTESRLKTFADWLRDAAGEA